MSDSEQIPSQIGAYRIERKIGAGGMGTVYLGVHEETGKEAAIKVLPPSMAREDALIARFNREIEALQKLANPHVVKLYESGTTEDTYFYAMEYIEGETLADRLYREQRIHWQDAIQIALQVCSALKSAHDAGIIHRDLKPSNLLIAKDGTVKLTDFGVAQVFAGSKLTKTGGVIGTVEYMSPEQAQGSRATKQSDLYSLGAVLYVMITGRPPFRGKTALEVIQKHKYGRFDRPILYVPEIPHWLDDLICQLLEKEPDKRVADAFVLTKKLQDVLNKVAYSQQGETVAVASSPSALAETIATSERPGGDIPAQQGLGTIMRDVIRAELDPPQHPLSLNRILNNTYVLIAMLALLIAGGYWWWQSRQLSPDEMFAAGVALMDEPAGEDWFTAREKYFTPLVETDAEKWSEKVEPYLRKIRIYELKTRLLPRDRKRAVHQPKSEAERFLVQAAAFRDLGDTARAESTLIALLALTDGVPESSEIHELAESLLQEIREQRKDKSDNSSWIENAIERAQKHLDAGQSAQARKILLGILTLYENDPSAQSSIVRVKKLLQKTEP
ncbi:MAG: hypothetical protein Tsb009_18710 [Planctomycetaceae bacterium]